MGMTDVNRSEGATASVPPSAAGAEASRSNLEKDVDRWVELLESGNLKPEALQQIVQELQAALNDPAKREKLEANGIDHASVDALEAGLSDPEKFNCYNWLGTLDSLETISGDGDLLTNSPARPALFELELGMSALKLKNADERSTALLETADEVGAAAEAARTSGNPASLDAEQVGAMRAAGMTAESTYNEKLGTLLDNNNADPSSVTFSADELEEIEEDMAGTATDLNETSVQQLNEIDRLHKGFTQFYDMLSAQNKAIFDGIQKSLDRIAQS